MNYQTTPVCGPPSSKKFRFDSFATEFSEDNIKKESFNIKKESSECFPDNDSGIGKFRKTYFFLFMSCSPDLTTNSETTNPEFSRFLLTIKLLLMKKQISIEQTRLAELWSNRESRIRSWIIGCWIWWANYLVLS